MTRNDPEGERAGYMGNGDPQMHMLKSKSGGRWGRLRERQRSSHAHAQIRDLGALRLLDKSR